MIDEELVAGYTSIAQALPGKMSNITICGTIIWHLDTYQTVYLQKNAFQQNGFASAMSPDPFPV